MSGSVGTPALSVVIPTRNRVAELERTLEALLAAGRGLPLEVVVADDGSADGTSELLAAARFDSLALRSVRLQGRGPAAARNRAVEQVRAHRVLLLGDDVRPAGSRTLFEHLDARGSAGRGFQGRIDWDPEAPVTEVMAFLAPAGPQFYFRHLEAGAVLSYTAVLGANLSAPTSWLQEDPFDEAFEHAAFEDTELAYRWQGKGRRVTYAPAALCWHHHHYAEIGPFLEKQRRAGRAARRALLRHPGMVPRVLLQPALFELRRLLRRSLRAMKQQPLSRAERWRLQTRAAFLRGLVAPED